MSIQYDSIVPWQRSFDEYFSMFGLLNKELEKRIDAPFRDVICDHKSIRETIGCMDNKGRRPPDIAAGLYKLIPTHYLTKNQYLLEHPFYAGGGEYKILGDLAGIIIPGAGSDL